MNGNAVCGLREAEGCCDCVTCIAECITEWPILCVGTKLQSLRRDDYQVVLTLLANAVRG